MAVPKVNIVVPCYNYAHYVRETIGSVLLQTYDDFVLTLVNDGSTDDSLSVLREYEDPPKVTVVDQANRGLSAARNAGVRAVESEYVLTLDADDLIVPTNLEQTVPILDENRRVGVVYTYMMYFGESNLLITNKDYDFELLKNENFLNSSSLFRRSAWEEAGGFDEDMRDGYEDWDFWIAMCKRGWSGRLVRQPLFLYRRHGVSMVSASGAMHGQLHERIKAKHRDIYG